MASFAALYAGGLLDADTRVLYIGDLDIGGSQIEANTRRVLERHAERTFDEDTWERLAITREQADDLRAGRLTGKPVIQKRDNRYSDGHPHEAYEAEALGQGTLERLLRDRLDDLIPDPIETFRQREREEPRTFENGSGSRTTTKGRTNGPNGRGTPRSTVKRRQRLRRLWRHRYPRTPTFPSVIWLL